jgi:oxalate decarboxylase/phosphoglucose isomerase-like protein (cupin superfamily)
MKVVAIDSEPAGSPVGAGQAWSRISPYQQWVESLGIPIHKGYYIEDLRTLPLDRWDERDCDAAVLILAGQEGITEARVTEIAPGKTLPPIRFGLDEVVYVVEGRGLTTLWGGSDGAKQTFEWQKHSLFLLPRGYHHQLSNVQGTAPARLLHYNYLPLAMAIQPDARCFFDNGFVDLDLLYGRDEFYSEAKAIRSPDGKGRTFWIGNFFPDMRAWDQLIPFRGRGAGGHVVYVQFPGSDMVGHMSVFPPQTYKKAHRHGPGVVIVIPAGEGYSVMWPEGQEKVIVPWHEASVFVPPSRWYHQHFNVGGDPARYLALHAPRPFRASERPEDRARDQIEYPEEDAAIRQKFEAALAARNLHSLMPERAYREPDFEWDYAGEE